MADHLTPATIKRIKLLRSHGYSLPEIKDMLHVGHGTVWRYIQDTKILPKYQKGWLEKRKSSVKRMTLAKIKARKEATNLIRKLNKKEKILIMCSIYWGEGGKRDFNLTNTDPNLIKLFIDGLIKTFGVTKERIRLSIRIYEGMDEKKCVNYWLKITSLSKSNLVSVNVIKGKKEGKLKYGMCRVRVLKAGNVLKYVNAIKEQIVIKFDSQSL